jgi:predicted O-linked N-acetylglucosamine transferase (SPINDLY family)
LKSTAYSSVRCTDSITERFKKTGMPGEMVVSRLGLSILSAAGLPEFIAHSEADYMRLAASLARDLPRLGALRSTLRQRMKDSAFMDAPRFAGQVEHAYREMWRKWCGRQE